MGAYLLEIREHVDNIFAKMQKKDPKTLEIIYKKLEKVLEDPFKFKPLRNNMRLYGEVHVNTHFVLVYSIDNDAKTVIIEDYDHHDKIFGK